MKKILIGCLIGITIVFIYSCRSTKMGSAKKTDESKQILNSTTKEKDKTGLIVKNNQTQQNGLKTILFHKPDTFASIVDLDSYLKVQENSLREKPEREFPDTLYYRASNGKVVQVIDSNPCSFYVPMLDIPEIYRVVAPNANFYLGKFDMYMTKYNFEVCRIENNNYLLPQCANAVFKNSDNKNISINDKIKFVFNTIIGKNETYQIVSIELKQVKVGVYNSTYEISFIQKNKNFKAYLCMNQDIFQIITILDENGKIIGNTLFK